MLKFDLLYQTRHPNESASTLLGGSEKILYELGTKTTIKLTREAGKVAAKQAAKVGAAEAAKIGVKKIPLVSVVAGGLFGLWRVGSGVYSLAQGDYGRMGEEFGKAGLEVLSGVAATVPGAGTAASLGIDAVLLGWDIGDVIHDSKTSKPIEKEQIITLIEADLVDIEDAINNKKYSKNELLKDALFFTEKKIGVNREEKRAADDAKYVYEMIKEILDKVIVADHFSTESIVLQLVEQGFSEMQIRCFRGLAKAGERD